MNEKIKNLFDIEDSEISIPMLNKAIYKYVKNNNLLEEKIYRVDSKLAEALNLSDVQIQQINSATSIKDAHCMSFYNCTSFIVNCIEL